jgi:trk system potassium uptake protein
MVVLFALLMLVPLAFALAEHDPASRLPDRRRHHLACGLVDEPATRRFRRELQPRDGFLLVG